jgi:hypothetical protein
MMSGGKWGSFELNTISPIKQVEQYKLQNVLFIILFSF